MNAEKIMQPLPWDWEQKKADFIKPGDCVLDVDEVGESLRNTPDESVNVLLSRGDFGDYIEACRVLKKGGFFLCERVGGDSSRALAEYLTPNSRPPIALNLENELPKMQAAGFRVMFRSQAYSIVRFTGLAALLRHIEQNPSLFPKFSAESAAPRLQKLNEDLNTRGFIPDRDHKFILIGKKR